MASAKDLVVLGEASPATAPVAKVVQGHYDWKSLAVYAVGGLLGHKLWKRHRWMGAVAGVGLGKAAYDAYEGKRSDAMYDAAAVAAAVAGTKLYKRKPVYGFVGGLAAATAVTSQMGDSPAHRALAKL